jgi:hypothetical protein
MYRGWKREGMTDYYCKQNFLNSRALKMTENIKLQLRDISKNTDLKLCEASCVKDPIYRIYRFKELKNLYN